MKQTPVTPTLIEELQERDRIGKERYGTGLTTFNGRSQLRDAIEEGLDLVQYLKAEEMERDAINARMELLEATARDFIDIARENPWLGDLYKKEVTAAKALLAGVEWVEDGSGVGG